MANYFFGVNKGQGDFDVTVASSTQSKDVELNILSTNITDKASVLLALEHITNQVIRSGFPPL
jgi:hypothetical protein